MSNVEKNDFKFNKIKNKLIDKIGNPIFETDRGVIFNGDSLEIMKNINFEFVDLTITSPPYNIGKEYEKIMPINEYIKWSKNWIRQVYSITHQTGALLLNVGYVPMENKARAIPISYLIWNEIDFFLNQEIVWNYGAGVSCKKYLSPRNEKLLWYVKNQDNYTFNLDDIRDKNIKYPNSKRNGKLRVNTLGKNPSDVWQIAKVTSGRNRQSKERTKHPCQFPVDLVDRTVLGFSNQNDIILDPFIGSGSTLESCIKHDRYCIGFEISRDYCGIIKDRINTNGISLFKQM